MTASAALDLLLTAVGFGSKYLRALRAGRILRLLRVSSTGAAALSFAGTWDPADTTLLFAVSAGVVVPAWGEPELMGLVDAWARGTSWSDLIANTSLDEGDVVRIMRRTVDLLAQVPYCEAISEQLRSHARQALKAINRFPVAEAEDLVPSSAALNPATERAA